MKAHRFSSLNRVSSLLALALGTSLTASAHAQLTQYDYGEFGPPAHREYSQSPQNVAVELRFGRYVPNADDGVNGTPYRDIFGTSNRYYVGAEVSWQVLRIPYLGTLAPAIAAGYTKSSARARYENEDALSGQDTTLTIYPMYVAAVLRADVIARETVVPLVPYAKVGMGVALWRIGLGDNLARVDGEPGRGISFGPQFALGGMFLLDFIDREDARTADSTFGLNHSYLFGEWFVSDLSGFGSSSRLNVGTNTWVVGLAVEF